MTAQVGRGRRNNNPGNIEFSPGTKWQGLAEPATDGRFCVFRSAVYGIRAMAVTLITYQDRHGLRTIEGIINRWAPPKNNAGQLENLTARYITNVEEWSGLDRTLRLDLHRHDHLRPLMVAMMRQEGSGAYPDAVLDEALTMAGVPPAPAAVAVRSSTSSAAAGTAAVGVGATAVVQVVEAVGPHVGVAADLVRSLGPWVVSLLVVLAAGYFIWSRVRRQREVAT